MKERTKKRKISCLIVNENFQSNLLTQLMLDSAISFDNLVTESPTIDAINSLSLKNIDLMLVYEADYLLDNFVILKEIEKKNFKGKIIFISNCVNPLYSELFFKANVHAYVSENESIDFLFTCINRVLSGYTLFTSMRKSEYLLPNMNLDEIMILLLLLEDKSTRFIRNSLSLNDKMIRNVKCKMRERFTSLYTL